MIKMSKYVHAISFQSKSTIPTDTNKERIILFTMEAEKQKKFNLPIMGDEELYRTALRNNIAIWWETIERPKNDSFHLIFSFQEADKRIVYMVATSFINKKEVANGYIIANALNDEVYAKQLYEEAKEESAIYGEYAFPCRT